MVFVTYTPQDRPKDPSIVNIFPPDPCGDDSEPGVVLQTGNDYIRYSADHGKTFQILANTAVIDNTFAGGEHGDQRIIFVSSIQCFVWYLQYNPVPANGDGAFRLAFAKLSNLQAKIKNVWSAYDWVSSDFGLKGTDFDYPDITATEQFLYVTTGTKSQGRLLARLRLSDFVAGSVSAEYLGLLSITTAKDKSTDSLRYAHLCENGRDRAILAGHVDNSTLRIFEWPDGGNLATHDVKTVTWPNTGDYASLCPDGTDWLQNGGDTEVSGLVRQSDNVWLAWCASRGSAGGAAFSYPNPHCRVATVRMSDWTETAEMQVWNPDYAFAFPDLSVNGQGEIALGVGWGGPSNFADAAFGIIGDFVVWYQDGSDAALTRWGDFVTVTQSKWHGNSFSGFGYFSKKDSKVGLKVYQEPYYVLFARKSQS
ncbi:hypothetical protein SAMN05444161_8791 [Rhizobiales bacterium GAS191]|nr:hypothetical protein SAMN05444161_8791 [Rhizobiales bacterium GAS191]